jgi:hypothetical protein
MAMNKMNVVTYEKIRLRIIFIVVEMIHKIMKITHRIRHRNRPNEQK